LEHEVNAAYFLGGTKAAAGTIALINSLGLIGGFASPTILGWVKATTGSLDNGLFVIAGFLTVGALTALGFGRRGRAGRR
jgi:nitrate/nitrite transporter NarK